MTDLIVKCGSCGKRNRVREPGRRNVCGSCGTDLEMRGTPVEVTDENFDALLSREPRVVVDFWAEWCGPCRRMAPVFAEVASRRTDVTFAKLDTEANRATSTRFNVQSIPMLVFFRDGQEAGRLVGLTDRAGIESALERYL